MRLVSLRNSPPLPHHFNDFIAGLSRTSGELVSPDLRCLKSVAKLGMWHQDGSC